MQYLCNIIYGLLLEWMNGGHILKSQTLLRLQGKAHYDYQKDLKCILCSQEPEVNQQLLVRIKSPTWIVSIVLLKPKMDTPNTFSLKTKE